MRMLNKRICLLFMAGMLLLLCGCIGTAQERPADTSENEVAIAASFRQEDGISLCGSTVRFSFGENCTDHFLDDNGMITFTAVIPQAS